MYFIYFLLYNVYVGLLAVFALGCHTAQKKINERKSSGLREHEPITKQIITGW